MPGLINNIEIAIFAKEVAPGRALGTCNPGPDLVYKLIGLIPRFIFGLYTSQTQSIPSQGGLQLTLHFLHIYLFAYCLTGWPSNTWNCLVFLRVIGENMPMGR